MQMCVSTSRETLTVEASKSGIKIVQRDQPLPQLAGLKERRIDLQSTQESMQIGMACDLILTRNDNTRS